MGRVSRIKGLVWAEMFYYYVLWMIVLYLTDVWKLEFTHAAGVINIWRGSIYVTSLVFVYVADAFLGNFCVLLLSSLSYVLGLGLLWMSTPPVLANANGNCSEYKPECIQDEQKHLFFAALALTSVGMAGHLASLRNFMAEQMENVTTELVIDDNIGLCSLFWLMFRNCSGFSLDIVMPFAGLMVVGFVKSWGVQFGVCALLALASFFAYLTGVRSYNYVRPQGSALTTIFRVVFAAFSKLFCRHPRNVNELYERCDVANADVAMLPHTKSLRCLDKAAIILPEPGLEQQAQNRWRLCRVTEVEATKTAIQMVPLCMTFIICGFVSAIGDTYFLEQARSLNPKLGHVKVSLVFFVWFYVEAKSLLSKFYACFVADFFGTSSTWRRHASAVGVGVGMIFSILCCITAAKIESKRLHTVESHDLIDKPDERVPMTMFWLLPQFLLLGGLDGIREWSVSYLVVDQARTSMVKYLAYFLNAVFGIGMMGSALLVQIVGKISGEKSGESWFQSTLNKSRLDKYYWVLAALSAVNLVIYVVVASLYNYKDPAGEELEEPENEESVSINNRRNGNEVLNMPTHFSQSPIFKK